MNYRLLVCLLLFAIPAAAQQKMVIVQGKMDSSIIAEYQMTHLIAQVYTSHIYDANLSEQYTVSLNVGGSYKFTLPVEDSMVYISFWMKSNTSDQFKSPVPVTFPYRSMNIFKELYLFEAGDNVRMDIRPEGVLAFSGPRTDKLNCQFQIRQLDDLNNGQRTRHTDLMNAREYERAAELDLSAVSRLINLRLDILKSYKGIFSDNLYNIICLDAIALSKFNRVFSLRRHIKFYNPNDSVRTIPIAKQYQQISYEKDLPQGVDSIYFSMSAYYPDLLFVQELNNYKILKFPNNLYYEPEIDFKDFLDYISSKYSGRLVEKLQLIAFYRLERSQAQSRQYAKAVIKAMQDNKIRGLLQSWSDKQFVAYPFELKDFDGKVHKLSDFKGKLVVIDFWYTGCMWCAVLNASMESIIERYKGNKKIVFLNVNVDKGRERWALGLKSGAYTSPGSLSLTTNGGEHEILKYYNYTSYPQLLLIDKKGGIISSFPPRPGPLKNLGDMEKDPVTGRFKPDAEATFKSYNTQKFIQLLEEHLK